jgi:hypothetical protein
MQRERERKLGGGARGSVVVKALWYEPEDRGSRPHKVNEFFQLTQSFQPH